MLKYYLYPDTFVTLDDEGIVSVEGDAAPLVEYHLEQSYTASGHLWPSGVVQPEDLEGAMLDLGATRVLGDLSVRIQPPDGAQD